MGSILILVAAVNTIYFMLLTLFILGRAIKGLICNSRKKKEASVEEEDKKEIRSNGNNEAEENRREEEEEKKEEEGMEERPAGNPETENNK